MRFFGSLLVALVCLVLAGGARADVTYEEAVCQVKASLASWNYFQKKIGCLVACQRGVRSGSIDPATCVPPYPPSPTYGCIQGKQGRANGTICSACSRDTPECYPTSAEPCPDTTHQWLTVIDGMVESFMPLFYCDDSGSPDGLTPYEGKCQDTVAKYSAKAAYQVARCYAKCRQNATKGLVPVEACTPPATDLYTQACLGKIATSTAYRIDRYCTLYDNQPECAPVSGDSWSALTRLAVEGFHPNLFCES